MSKPYSEADFSTQITQDRSWRLREISDLKTAIIRADDNLRRVLLRALITICYAHWEGYIRFAARKYTPTLWEPEKIPCESVLPRFLSFHDPHWLPRPRIT